MEAVKILRQLLADTKKELYSDLTDRFDLQAGRAAWFMKAFPIEGDESRTAYEK